MVSSVTALSVGTNFVPSEEDMYEDEDEDTGLPSPSKPKELADAADEAAAGGRGVRYTRHVRRDVGAVMGTSIPTSGSD